MRGKYQGKSRRMSSGSFAGVRKPVKQIPVIVKRDVRTWADRNGLYYDQNKGYLLFRETLLGGKDKLVRLYINYYKSEHCGIVLRASNHRIGNTLNVGMMMHFEVKLEQLNFEQLVNPKSTTL